MRGQQNIKIKTDVTWALEEICVEDVMVVQFSRCVTMLEWLQLPCVGGT